MTAGCSPGDWTGSSEPKISRAFKLLLVAPNRGPGCEANSLHTLQRLRRRPHTSLPLSV